MPVTLKQVVDHVVAIEELEGPVDRHKVTAMIREAIGALGLLVNARNDEVYNPAEGVPQTRGAPPARRGSIRNYQRIR